ncbi:head protein [Hyalangium versicolor]|uniref:head protein n=1 Tax=Hyalangium versicolor TaxID=2861190 RepID=UPI001CC904EC|nr:head protein [Hyalangium versicolor]
MSMVELCLEVEGLLGRLREEASPQEEQEKLLIAIDAIRFLSASGQSYDFEDYRKSLDANAPPLVIAAFNTLEAAESWLKEQPEPPASGCVLVGNEYCRVMYSRETGLRKLIPSHSTLEYYLEEMIQDGLPAPDSTFNTREEADSWLSSQAEPPRQVFITIAGEYYLAVYHYRVRLRALYPISRAAKSQLEHDGKG